MNLASKDRRLTCDSLGLAALSLAAGCTDVLTFLKLGALFTSAMTGNTALLAIAIGRGQALAASRALTALLGFILGVAIATAMSAAASAPPDARRALRRLLLLELVFLVACAALWRANAEPLRGVVLYMVILLSSLSMGIQAMGAGSINLFGVNTIVFTSALVRVVSSVTRALARRGENSELLASIGPHLATFVAYGCGAWLAAAFVAQHLHTLIWVPAAAVIGALGLSGLAGGAQEGRGKG